MAVGGDFSDHVIRETVNQLRDIAMKYHAAGQLREQIAGVIVPLLKDRAPAANAAGQPPVWYVARSVDGKQHDTGRVERVHGGFLASTYSVAEAQFIADALNWATAYRATATSAAGLKPYTFDRNHCTCHPETCACDAWAVFNPDGTKLCGAYDKQRAERMTETLNRDSGRPTAKGAAGQEGSAA